MILTTYIDAVTQTFCNRESANLFRVTTDFIDGFCIMFLVSIIGKYIGDEILLILNPDPSLELRRHKERPTH